jgi:hypothetical protein
MSEARLAPGIEVSALLARATAEGGFGAVLHKGDPERGTIALVLMCRGEGSLLLQRRLQAHGQYGWEARDFTDSASLGPYLARLRTGDPDMWVLELDVPSTERFIAEMT